MLERGLFSTFRGSWRKPPSTPRMIGPEEGTPFDAHPLLLILAEIKQGTLQPVRCEDPRKCTARAKVARSSKENQTCPAREWSTARLTYVHPASWRSRFLRKAAMTASTLLTGPSSANFQLTCTAFPAPVSLAFGYRPLTPYDPRIHVQI